MNFSKTIGHFPDDFVLKIFPDRDIFVTGASLRRDSAVYASWLQRRGIRSLGIHMGNCPEFFLLFAGAMRAGVKVRLFNALREAQGDFPIYDRASAAAVMEAERDTGCGFTEYDWKPDEPFLEMSTSGTNGKPKTVEKTIRNLFGGPEIPMIWRLLIKPVKIKAYNSFPWYHASGFSALIFILGGLTYTEICMEKFNPEEMRICLNEYRPNFIMTTPTMLTRCALSGEVRLPSFVMCSGEALSVEAVKRFEACKSGQLLYSIYGSTELGAVAHFLYVFHAAKLSGHLLAKILRSPGYTHRLYNRDTLEPDFAGEIVNDLTVKILRDGQELPDGEKGEIWCRPGIRAAGLGPGLFHTGDVGYIRGRLLYVCGRSLNVINRSGEKIMPSDIEDVVTRMPGVRSAVVFGVPSPTHGEDICLAVESEGGRAVVDKTSLSNVLPKYMIPQRLFFWDSFPLNATGKIDISAIRSRALMESDSPDAGSGFHENIPACR